MVRVRVRRLPRSRPVGRAHVLLQAERQRPWRLWWRCARASSAAGCRVQGQGAGCRVQGAGCRVQGAGCRVQGAGCIGAREHHPRPWLPPQRLGLAVGVPSAVGLPSVRAPCHGRGAVPCQGASPWECRIAQRRLHYPLAPPPPPLGAASTTPWRRLHHPLAPQGAWGSSAAELGGSA